MSPTDAFDERKRALEEEYFRKKEAELIEKMRARLAAERERKNLSEATGVEDDALLLEMQELGFTHDTIELMHVIPLVNVAWADGGVSKNERDLLLQVATARGIAEASPAHELLTSWLDKRPSDEFFDKSLQVLRAMLKSHPDATDDDARNLVTYCKKIAEISGGILGIGRKVSDEEQQAIDRIVSELVQDHAGAARLVVEEI